MITAKRALDALVERGHGSLWKKVVYRKDGLRWTEFRVESESFQVSDETYGNQSFLYIQAKSKEIAAQIFDVLRSVGGKPGTEWNGGLANGNIELQVSLFQGFHHWE